jgi:hypothetical protein
MRRPTLIAGLAVIGALVASSKSPPPMATAAAGEPVAVTLFTHTVVWRAAPRTYVTADLLRGGRLQSRAEAMAGDAGEVTLHFFDYRLDRQGRDAALRPADVLALRASGAGSLSAVTVTLPTLLVSADPVADRLAGQAPPRAALHVRLQDDQAPAGTADREWDVAADANGNFALDLTAAPGGAVDLRAGHHGSVAFTTPEGHAVTALFAVFEADLTLASPRPRGRATPGQRLDVMVEHTDGTHDQDSMALVDGIDWVLPGEDSLPRIPALASGDRVRLTLSGGTLPAPVVREIAVPPLTVELDATQDTVSGGASPGATLTVAVTSPDGQTVLRRRITAGPDGRFRITFAGVADLAAGWRADVIEEVGQDISVRGRRTLADVRIGVHTSHVYGTIAPGAVVWLTLFGPDGAVKGKRVTTADATGAFDATPLDDATLVWPQIEPGDMVEVAFAEGDPFAYPVPRLSTRTDPDAETVSGEAPVGAHLSLRSGDHSPPLAGETIADVNGRYVFDFRGATDVEPPMFGTIAFTEPGGATFVAGWAAVALWVGATQAANVTCIPCPVGQLATLRVADEAGQHVVYRPMVRPDAPSVTSQGTASINILAESGDRLPLMPGDKVDVIAGNDVASVTLPPMAFHLDLAHDRMVGHTLPHLSLQIVLKDSVFNERPTVSVVSDGSGDFAVDFTGSADLGHVFTASVTAQLGRHRVVYDYPVPHLDLDLDTGILKGRMPKLAEVRVTVESGGQPRAIPDFRSDGFGFFETALYPDTGPVIDLLPGDVLRVVARSVADTVTETLTVPELTFAIAPAANRVSGRATDGGTLYLVAESTFSPIAGWLDKMSEGATIALGAGGTFSFAFSKVKLGPGWQVSAQEVLPDGNSVRRTRYVPIVNVQHGGPNVCGYGLPGEDVHVETSVGGAPAGQGATRIGHDGRFSLVLRDEVGRPTTNAAGTHVDARLGQTAATVDLPEIAFVAPLIESTYHIEGQGPPNATWILLVPVNDCFSKPGVVGDQGLTDANGRFSATAWTSSGRPGETLELSFYLADGFRIYRHATRPVAHVYVGTPRIGGRVSPMARGTAVLRGPDDAERGREVGAADGDGQIDLRLADRQGHPVASRPGDVLELAAGGDSASVRVEPLTFDFDTTAGVIGTAPPNHPVGLVLTLANGRAVRFFWTTDATGRLRYGPSDVSVRAGWSLADVQHVRLELPTLLAPAPPAGHLMVTESVAQTEPTRPVFLPLAVRKARTAP